MMTSVFEAARLIAYSEALLRDVLRMQDEAARAADAAHKERADLLTALRDVVRWQLNDDAIAKLGFDPTTYKAAFGRARAAIAKAEGEAP